jgi:hypothetical protein
MLSYRRLKEESFFGGVLSRFLGILVLKKSSIRDSVAEPVKQNMQAQATAISGLTL